MIIDERLGDIPRAAAGKRRVTVDNKYSRKVRERSN